MCDAAHTDAQAHARARATKKPRAQRGIPLPHGAVRRGGARDGGEAGGWEGARGLPTCDLQTKGTTNMDLSIQLAD